MSKKQLKILHLLSQRPESTGSGIYVQAMLRESEARNHRNVLVAGIPENNEPALTCIDSAHCSYVPFESHGLPYSVAGMSDVMPYPSTRFRDLSDSDLRLYERAFAEQLEAVVRKFEPDLVHSHHLWVVTALARRLFPALAVVASCHGSDLRQFRTCPHIAGRIAGDCRNLNAVLALSRSQKNEIEALYQIPGERIHVVGAGFNKALFYPEPKPSPKPVQVVYAGKLSRSKGVPSLLRALSDMDALDWNLHLVGDGSGPERDECLELAGRLESRVVVHGPLPQESLARIMRRSHLFVLPSFFEGLPLVLMEALSSGCRLVSTALPGVLEAMGDISRDYVRLVRLPRLYDVDKPVEADMQIYEANLRGAIEEQITAIQREPDIDLSLISRQVSAFEWPGVFERIERIYYGSGRP